MSMKGRKWSPVLISTMLVGSMLAGCSAPPGGSAGGSTAVPDSKDAKATAPTVAQAPLEINFMLALFDQLPDMKNEIWTEIQKRTNTKMNIEWVPSGDYDTKMDLVLASGNIPDVIFATTTNRPTILKAFENGAFWDLAPFLGDFSKYPNLKKNSATNVFRYVTKNKKIMGMVRNRPYIDQGIKLRKDWLDKLNMKIPTTMDEYADTLIAMVEKDPDGNGKKDTFGYVHPGGTGIPGNFLAAFGTMKPQFTSDNKGIIHSNLNSGYTDTVEYMRNLYARGGMPEEFATIKATQAQELFETGQAASYIRNIWRAWTFQQNIKKVQPNAEVVIAAPKGPKGDAAVNFSLDTYGALYISKKVPEEKVKRILDYWEKTNTPEFFDLIFFGVEGVHYNVVNGYKVMTEKGAKQIDTSVQQPLPMMWNDWWKSYDKNAPKEYNDKIWTQVKEFGNLGKLDPFTYLKSDTWTANWSKYNTEWTSMVVQTIMGKKTMDEYKKYIESIQAKPEFQKAFQEFKTEYDEYQSYK
ncbi:extracellular solute-binding protein [Paenibacillus agricola]|uniref:Extracellular solute-binding protein n=1 Tax=Paenibacillus agricola TaxID=2716264 RepID=A0ABX0J8L0_9BACL|nr:extracellular solute-binding protein [Paenibacillus agricola]NHN32705.1 extracellular solute-binding protein [Paenibacillus agricola]